MTMVTCGGRGASAHYCLTTTMIGQIDRCIDQMLKLLQAPAKPTANTMLRSVSRMRTVAKVLEPLAAVIIKHAFSFYWTTRIA
jgi:hypothetical protein